MKKLVLIIVFLFGAFTISEAQIIKKKKIKVETAKYVAPVGNFNLIFIDTEGQMDVHETMKTINPEHDPLLIIIKDEKEGYWRLATTLEEANRMPDDMSVVGIKYKEALPYKRTGYN